MGLLGLWAFVLVAGHSGGELGRVQRGLLQTQKGDQI